MPHRLLLVKISGRHCDVIIIQALASSAEREDIICVLYSDQYNAVNMCRNSSINIILGEFNANVGNKQGGYTVGKCGGECNDFLFIYFSIFF